MRTCLPADYQSKHINPQTFVRFADDGPSAVVDTDGVWIAQNLENVIIARCRDDVIRRDGRGSCGAARNSR